MGIEGARGKPGFPAIECKLGASVTNWLIWLGMEPAQRKESQEIALPQANSQCSFLNADSGVN